MRDLARVLEGLVRDEDGNTTMLLMTVCLAFIGVTILTLDIFSILISRHYAQTDADAAAISAVMTIQPIVTKVFARAVDQKVDQMIEAAKAEWEERAPDTEMADYVKARVSEQIGDAEVFAYLAGQSARKPDPARMITAILTPKERGCTLQQAATEAQGAAESKAREMLRSPAISTVTLNFPFDNKPWVFVAVKRIVPSILVRKVLGKDPTATVESGATLRGLADMTLAPCT